MMMGQGGIAFQAAIREIPAENHLVDGWVASLGAAGPPQQTNGLSVYVALRTLGLPVSRASVAHFCGKGLVAGNPTTIHQKRRKS